ncbi:MAG: MFS transporter, partial [Armatimonadetes bacterium 13_1_40CM_3_65_7]
MPDQADAPAQVQIRSALTGNVLVSGLVSFFTDVSSEMIVPVLPLFVTAVLGASMTAVGLIEGVAESTASVMRSFAGLLSDRFGRRKALIVFGYSLSNVTKPLLALTGSWGQVLAIRFGDRLGKGIRGAPRDALIADSVAAERRGLAFGFHRSLDTAGAALGPLIAFGTLAIMPENYRAVFWIATIPGAFAILIAGVFLRDLRRPAASHALGTVRIGGLGRRFAVFTAIITLFALGNSSDAFLILRAKNLGLPVATIPLIYFAFNVVYAVLSIPAGALSDRLGRRGVLIVGYVVFAIVYLGFAVASGPAGRWIVLPLFLTYGIYYALTEGVQRAFVVDLVPADLRATALGTFASATG